MAKLLLNADGKVLTSNDKVLKAPETVNIIKTLLDSRRDAKYLFYDYPGTSVDDFISYSTTENVIDMNSMFYACTKLQTIPQLNTSLVENMSYTFYRCNKLQTIDITSLDKISSANNLTNFAAFCFSLTKLIIRTMTVIPPLNTTSFHNCYRFEGKANSTYNPTGAKDGRIYVPDDKVEELKAATNWSAFADIIVPLSTLVEE